MTAGAFAGIAVRHDKKHRSWKGRGADVDAGTLRDVSYRLAEGEDKM